MPTSYGVFYYYMATKIDYFVMPEHSKGQTMLPKKEPVVLLGSLFNDCKQGRWMQSHASLIEGFRSY